MNEEEFWTSTLRKICALLDIYNEVNKPKGKGYNNNNNNKSKNSTTKGETVTLKCVD